MANVDEIVASAAEARKQLGKLEHRLQGEIDGVDFIAFERNRPLNEAERKQRRQLRSSQVEVRDAFTQLAFVTLERLDNSDEVLRLEQRMKAIQATLADDLEHLKRIERIAETVAKVSDTVADVVSKIAEKAADLAL
jgi:outer membrane lipopolysaccharide assembly protein LptE/RlpB